uniref:uncharacterized protein LOC120328891 n=1 Tax=Styela clava TaxID=7725 RepID=UPI001939CBEE|nr:uncharacterized protein LOC120328891 [Styela clava]
MPSNIRDQDREPEVLEREINMSQNTAATEYNEDDVMVKSSTNQVSIKPHDREKVLHNMIIFLNPSSTTPEIGLRCDSHKNVALEFSQTEILYKDMKLSSLDIYKMNLQQLLAEATFFLSDNYIRSVLLQVTGAIDHLHKLGKKFGRITAEHIYLSCQEQSQDSPKIVLTESSQANAESGELDKAEDVAFLGEFFKWFLEEVWKKKERHLQCYEKSTAKDLISKMVEKSVNTKDILQHPLLWTVEKKITFLCDAHDSIKHRSIEERVEREGQSVTGGDWIKTLSLFPREKTEIEAVHINGKKKQINIDILKNCASGKTKNTKFDYATYLYDERKSKLTEMSWTALQSFISNNNNNSENHIGRREEIKKLLEEERINKEPAPFEIFGPVILVKTSEEFKKDSLCDLLRFFRNRKAHYWESKQNIKRCFQSNPDGFWRFFSSRYPDLLPFVYEHRMMFMGPLQNA